MRLKTHVKSIAQVEKEKENLKNYYRGVGRDDQHYKSTIIIALVPFKVRLGRADGGLKGTKADSRLGSKVAPRSEGNL